MRIQKHRLLMIPGPTEIGYESLLAMAQPSIVHYGDDWIERYDHVVEDAYASNTLTSFCVPEGATDSGTVDLMRDRFDIIIANSHHPHLLGKMLRVGHLGMTADQNCILLTLTALAESFTMQGAKVDGSAAIDAALSVFREEQP